jgi:hypothetical protein
MKYLGITCLCVPYDKCTVRNFQMYMSDLVNQSKDRSRVKCVGQFYWLGLSTVTVEAG